MPAFFREKFFSSEKKIAFSLQLFYTVPMEEKNELPIKTYQFKFTPLMIAVISVGILLCAACFALTTWQFLGFLSGDITSAYEWMMYVLLYFTSVFLAILLSGLLIRSRYIVTDKLLITQFGIVKSKYPIRKIRSVCLLNGSKKLNLYFDDFKTKYMTIVVKEDWYDEFVQTLISRNESIEFDFSSAEDEMNGKKKK